MTFFRNYITSVVTTLEKIEVTDGKGQKLDIEKGLSCWCEVTTRVKRSNTIMYFVGNGASAAMASHMSADACKNGGFCSQAFNDIALMTAVSNDISYEVCFELPLRRFAKPGDVLVSISSSGNSANIIRAIEVAQELGLQIITLSGMKPNNKSRQMGDLNFYVPADAYGIVEVSHQVLLHCWLDKFMSETVD